MVKVAPLKGHVAKGAGGKPTPRPGNEFYVYLATYPSGDGRVKEVELIGASATVESSPSEGLREPEHIYFVDDYDLLEKNITKDAYAEPPLIDVEDGGVRHRLYSLGSEDVLKKMTAAFRKTRFCHKSPRRGKPGPVWIGNLASSGWVFSGDAAFSGKKFAKKNVDKLAKKIDIREYPFPDTEGRSFAILDFLEDLRFESVAADVLGLVMPGEGVYRLLTSRKKSDDFFKDIAGELKLDPPEVRPMLADAAVEESERTGRPVIIVPAPSRRDVKRLAVGGAVLIGDLPLAFTPISGILFHAD